jgi:glycosyltransferase involved in cell wall biosynthesis
VGANNVERRLPSSTSSPDPPQGRPSAGIINGSSRFSGVTKSAEPFIPALERAGYSVRWYQCVDRGFEPARPTGAILVPGAGFAFNPLEMGLNRLWVFPRRLETPPEDAVFFTDPTLSFIARRHRCRVALVHDLSPLTRFSDRVDSSLMFQSIIPLLRRMDRIIVGTGNAREELVPYGVARERIRVVYASHDLGFHPDHLEASVGRVEGTGELRVLYIATDRPRKNIEFFLHLAKRMADRPGGHRFRFRLVSHIRPATRATAESLHLENLEILEGVSDIASIYASSDVLAYPSLYEGFGRPLVEALAFGLPIVANRTEPFIELLSGSRQALIPVNDPSRWVAELESLAESSVYRERATDALSLNDRFRPELFQESVRRAVDGLLPADSTSRSSH